MIFCLGAVQFQSRFQFSNQTKKRQKETNRGILRPTSQCGIFSFVSIMNKRFLRYDTWDQRYTVSEGRVFFLIWPWQREICKSNLIWSYLYTHYVWTFDLYPWNLILVSWDGLHSLQDKRCQKSIKQWSFDDPFHIERPG